MTKEMIAQLKNDLDELNISYCTDFKNGRIYIPHAPNDWMYYYNKNTPCISIQIESDYDITLADDEVKMRYAPAHYPYFYLPYERTVCGYINILKFIIKNYLINK